MAPRLGAGKSAAQFSNRLATTVAAAPVGSWQQTTNLPRPPATPNRASAEPGRREPKCKTVRSISRLSANDSRNV
jgi:hypothetical protein